MNDLNKKLINYLKKLNDTNYIKYTLFLHKNKFDNNNDDKIGCRY